MNGMYRKYTKGVIYFGNKVGRAHIVTGSILNKYTEKSAQVGFLGYPTTDETSTPNGIGRFNHFQGGSIYWTQPIGAHVIHGLIREKWASLGWEKSSLGFPLTDELETEDGIGRFTVFQGGRIYYHPETGTHPVSGKILLEWLGNKDNNQVGDLGYPTSDAMEVNQTYNNYGNALIKTGYKQTFQKGYISTLDPKMNDGIDLRGEISRRGITIKNQGKDRGTCSVQTMSFLLEYAYSGMYGNAYSNLSVEYLNHVSNKATGKTDDGDIFSSMVSGYDKYGTIKESVWPYDKDWTYTYAEAEKKLTQAMLDEGKWMISNGKKFEGRFLKLIESKDGLTTSEFNAIINSLDKGIPVALGRSHSMAIVGYQKDTSYDGGGYFIYRNSYGVNNGINGYKLGSFKTLIDTANDAYIYERPAN